MSYRLMLVLVCGLWGCGDDGAAADGSGDGSGTEADDSSAESTASDGSTSGASGSGGVIGDCSTPGWSMVTMPWSKLNYEGAPETGGYTICVPESWAVTSDASNVIQLQRDGEVTIRLQLAGELRLDHADAVTRVLQSADCQRDDFEGDVLEIDGWPALQERYSYVEAACGECDEPTDLPAYATSTYVAADVWLVTLIGTSTVPADPTVVEELIAIGRTVSTTELPAPDAAETAQDMQRLEAALSAQCD